MFTLEVIFYPKAGLDLPGFVDDELMSYLSVLYRNGQLIKQHWNLIYDQGVFKLFCIAPAEDSLDAKFYSQLGLESLARVKNKSAQPPTVNVLGPTVGLSDCCSCADPSCYVLFTNYVAEYPPISCGDCNLPVPLYQLPKVNNEPDYSSLLHWESEYQACDALFINSWVGEKFGYGNMSQENSMLSQEGLEICHKMSVKAGKPFYYFLHKHYEAPGENCPICGQPWKLDEVLFDLYSYKCDRCRIIADKP